MNLVTSLCCTGPLGSLLFPAKEGTSDADSSGRCCFCAGAHQHTSGVQGARYTTFCSLSLQAVDIFILTLTFSTWLQTSKHKLCFHISRIRHEVTYSACVNSPWTWKFLCFSHFYGSYMSTLIQAEICQQLLDGMAWNFAQRFTAPRGWGSG